MIVPLSKFNKGRGRDTSIKKYLVLYNEILKYPICLYRLDEDRYTALLMKCTHQGTELQAFGQKLQCPAHGSEFDDHGNVTHGPAAEQLRTFPVTISNDHLKISLK
jgi:nitrite reductase/ring-hydroxylating ferredoxin subunit